MLILRCEGRLNNGEQDSAKLLADFKLLLAKKPQPKVVKLLTIGDRGVNASPTPEKKEDSVGGKTSPRTEAKQSYNTTFRIINSTLQKERDTLSKCLAALRNYTDTEYASFMKDCLHTISTESDIETLTKLREQLNKEKFVTPMMSTN